MSQNWKATSLGVQEHVTSWLSLQVTCKIRGIYYSELLCVTYFCTRDITSDFKASWLDRSSRNSLNGISHDVKIKELKYIDQSQFLAVVLSLFLSNQRCRVNTYNFSNIGLYC